jgi:NADPH-dependent 7-cyano-7-deazaguanine reductase QueF-like protein
MNKRKEIDNNEIKSILNKKIKFNKNYERFIIKKIEKKDNKEKILITYENKIIILKDIWKNILIEEEFEINIVYTNYCKKIYI